MIIKLASSSAVNVMKKYKIMDIYMVFMSMHRMSHAISVRSVLQKNSNLFVIVIERFIVLLASQLSGTENALYALCFCLL